MEKIIHLYIASCAEDGGIYHYKLEDATFTLEEKLTLKNPMYMALAEDKLYCVLNDPFEGRNESGVARIGLENGYFGECSAPAPTHGVEGCHICLSDGKIYVANYTSGNLCRLPELTAQHSGHSVNIDRQSEPHTHCIIPTPDGKYLCATDLGTDEIIVYSKDLTPRFRATLPPGSGPRHLLFSDDGKRLYCVNELISGVSVFSYNDGELTYKNTVSSLPADFKGESFAAAIRLYNGKIYVSNRGHDSIAFFDENGGDLGEREFVKTGGRFPRDFYIVEDMLLSANELSDTVTVFRLESGKPVATDTVLHMKRPLAIEVTVISK